MTKQNIQQKVKRVSVCPFFCLKPPPQSTMIYNGQPFNFLSGGIPPLFIKVWIRPHWIVHVLYSTPYQCQSDGLCSYVLFMSLLTQISSDNGADSRLRNKTLSLPDIKPLKVSSPKKAMLGQHSRAVSCHEHIAQISGR